MGVNSCSHPWIKGSTVTENLLTPSMPLDIVNAGSNPVDITVECGHYESFSFSLPAGQTLSFSGIFAELSPPTIKVVFEGHTRFTTNGRVFRIMD